MLHTSKTLPQLGKPQVLSAILIRLLILMSLLLLIHRPAIATEPLHTTASAISEDNPSAPPLQVVLMVKNTQNPFWRQVEQAATKAASDLGIRLQVVDINNNPLRPIRVLSSLVNSSHKPDAVLFPNIKNTGKAILELLEKNQIYGVLYDNGFSPKDNMGKPGQYYRYWLGNIEIDNYNASRKLTQELIEEALQRFPDQRPLPMVVLDGSSSSRSAAQRLLGMFDALVSYKDQVDIRQIFHTRYDPDHAYNATLSAKQRYPEIRIIWAANDAMALRAIEALKESDSIPGQDILVTGFDLIPEARQKIQQKELFNSYGGHYMSAAWGLVYIYDQLRAPTPHYRHLNIPLHSGKAPFSAQFLHDKGENHIETDRDFYDVDFTLFSHLLSNPKGTNGSPKYLFEANSNP